MVVLIRYARTSLTNPAVTICYVSLYEYKSGFVHTRSNAGTGVVFFMLPLITTRLVHRRVVFPEPHCSSTIVFPVAMIFLFKKLRQRWKQASWSIIICYFGVFVRFCSRLEYRPFPAPQEVGLQALNMYYLSTYAFFGSIFSNLICSSSFLETCRLHQLIFSPNF